MSEAFDADWLSLREGFDARSRDAGLALRLAEILPPRPHLVDLGAGTGSLLRWLAPMLRRSQFWTLVDADAALLGEAFAEIEDFAAGLGWTTTWPRRDTLLVHTPDGVWRVEGRSADLAAGPGALPLDKADAVLCSAFCDLVSQRWVDTMAAGLRLPFYAALNVDGHQRFAPPHPDDALLARGFRRDQIREKGFGGKALGPRATQSLARSFRARGFRVETAASPWIVRPSTPRMADALAEGQAQAALAALPRRLAPRIEGWAATRRLQAMRAKLSVRVGHTDLLAIPG